MFISHNYPLPHSRRCEGESIVKGDYLLWLCKAKYRFDNGKYEHAAALARAKFPPRKPYIVATFTVCLVKCEDNGERILYVPRTQHCKTG